MLHTSKSTSWGPSWSSWYRAITPHHCALERLRRHQRFYAKDHHRYNDHYNFLEYQNRTAERLQHKVSNIKSWIQAWFNVYVFVQLLFSCLLMVKESCTARSLTALWGGLSKGAKAQTLAGKPSRGLGPNHDSILRGTTTQTAKVCGPGIGWPWTVSVSICTLCIHCEEVARMQVNHTDHIVHASQRFMSQRGYI